jgi:hypothetical protein
MKAFFRRIFPLCLCVGSLAPTSRGQNLTTIGVTALRAAIATNVDGTGVRVLQAEAAAPAFEVNPGTVGQPAGLFTYYSAAGSANAYPNSVGTESTHADQVGQQFYGFTTSAATNVARVDNFDADFFYTNYVAPNRALPVSGDAVANQSFTFGPLSVSDQQELDSQYDNYSYQNNLLFVSAADNYGFNPTVCAPGTSYNCLSVGAYYNGTNYNSVGPTSDNGRCKPDITALSGETSFSTPQVAGAAAALMQAALRGDGGGDTNSADALPTIKALLLNGAVKPLGWTNGYAAPLDARYGAGLLNIFNSYEELIGGKHGYIVSATVSSGGAHPPTGATGTVGTLNGWDYNTNSSGIGSDTVNHYYFNVTNGINGAAFVAAMTLVWNRHYNANYLVSPEAINNLNLFLYNCANNNLVNCSTSVVDNVEHLYMTNLPPGRYDLQVWKAGGTPGINIVSAAEPYALAWAFVTPPTPAITNGANPTLSWPLYPAGYTATATTNLMPPATWTESGLPAVTISNKLNCLFLPATSPAQFFRLVSPNF